MSNDMNLIMENWRRNVLVEQDLCEEEFDKLINPKFMVRTD